MRIKTSDIPRIKLGLLEHQGWVCPLCHLDLRSVPARDLCLDHCHDSGFIRAVLCRNCNSMEGKITRCIKRAKRSGSFWDWLQALLKYWTQNNIKPSGVIHPSHKTPEEKRLLYKKRAKRRAKKKRPKKKVA